MTMVATRAWLSEIGNRVGNGLKRSKKNTHHAQPSTLGILAFETARTMSRLVSLYKSLSDDELLTLKKEVVRYEGVAYLNSNDEPFLLNLACAERLEELNQAATVVARLGKKCSDPALNGFEDVYADLKFGFIDLVKLDFASKEVEKMIHKMEKLISATSVLYSGLEALAQLEVSERKLNQWRNNGTLQTQKANFDLFDEKLALQRQQVHHYREVSLWKRTFGKTVGLMARTVCIVYARICAVFGPYISAPPRHGLFQYQPPLQNRDWPERNIFCTKSGPISKTPKPVNDVFCTKSGPISKTSKPSLIRFSSGDDGFHIGIKENHFYLFGGVGKKEKVLQAAPAGTLGDSGLALRYANVIILAERYLNSPCLIGDDARENLYQMLPTSLKMLVRSKLKNIWRKEGELGARGDESLAEGWREAATVILGWLAPMAHDTVRWQAERNFERQHFDARPTVLLLQTLHFSDREKTEAAIAEVLVGLSCICRYENRCFSSI